MSYNFNFMLYTIISHIYLVFYNGGNRIPYKPPLCAARKIQGCPDGYIPHRSMSGFSQMPCVKNCSLMSSILQKSHSMWRIPVDTRLPAGTKCTSGTVHIDINSINVINLKKKKSELDTYLLFYELQMFIIRSRCCTTCFVGPRSKKQLYSATCRHIIKSISTFKLMCVFWWVFVKYYLVFLH